MKKVGIITIYDENNYGNRLQNYAVQEVIKSLGFEAETIKNTNIVNGENYLERAEKIDFRRREKFLKFNEDYMSNTDEVIFHNEVSKNFHEKYDYFVIGSDQIWNYNFEDRFSEFAFAKFAPQYKRIALSASFGISEIPKEDYVAYKGLEEMKAISVREFAGAKIVKEITGRDDALVVLDPTMMLPVEKWISIMKKPEQLKNDKYILKYFLGNVSDEKEKEIEKFAKEHGCDIVDVLDEDSFYATGPSEFLYLVKNAFLVLTDSFHSCVFSILFEKPFLIFERDQERMSNMYSRIDTLLQIFQLEGRKFEGKIKEQQMSIDYSNIKDILKTEREKEITFLKEALEIKE